MIALQIWQIYLDVSGTARLNGEYDLSERMLKAAMEEAERMQSKPREWHCTLELARVSFDQKHYRRALKIYREAIELYEKILGPESDTLIPFLDGMAEVYSAAGKLEKASSFLERSCRLSKVHGDRAAVRRKSRYLTWLYCQIGRTDLARELMAERLLSGVPDRATGL